MSASECTTASPAGVTPAAAAAVSAPAADRVGAPWRAPLELTMLGAIWGGSFLFMRVAAADFGPLPLVEARLSLGALILLPLLWAARARFSLALWLRIAGIAAINSVIPFALFAWAAERAPAGIGAISNAMTVMFTALIAFLFYGERIGPRRLVGLVAGFVGVAILASGRTAGASVWPAAMAGTTAALLYGIGINLVRRYLTGYPSGAVAAANLVSGSVLLAPLAIYEWPRHAIAAGSWVSAVLLGVLCTGIAFVFYYRLIGRVGAARASTVTYLIPLFGVIWAWLILGEPLTLTMALAGALILAGVALSQREVRRQANR
ncbi:MAG: DMT family transporter [Gammaproteobacteria bacterium]|nr:MAG: DMT family transporter [Gammaproteobacteria bacterium]TLY86019.1 MAG: DMT family transporter [Gammaproteobacteria bacterium]